MNEPGTPAGALKHEKYMVVAYMDQSSKKWRIYSFGPAADAAREAASAREWTTKEDGETHPKFRYRNLAHWLILDGKLAEAWKAIARSKQLASSPTPKADEAFRQSARSSDAELNESLLQYEAFIRAISPQATQAN